MHAILLFLHIVGALGLFAGLGLEQASLLGLRRATTTTQAREWVRLWRRLPRVDGPAALTVLATGLYLAAARHAHDAWIWLALLGMVAMGALGGAVTRRRVRAIAATLPAGDGTMPIALRQRLHDPVLRTSASFRLAIALGIVFEMSVKPATAAALATMAVALVAGAAAARAGNVAGRSAVPAGQYGAESS